MDAKSAGTALSSGLKVTASARPKDLGARGGDVWFSQGSH